MRLLRTSYNSKKLDVGISGKHSSTPSHAPLLPTSPQGLSSQATTLLAHADPHKPLHNPSFHFMSNCVFHLWGNICQPLGACWMVSGDGEGENPLLFSEELTSTRFARLPQNIMCVFLRNWGPRFGCQARSFRPRGAGHKVPKARAPSPGNTIRQQALCKILELMSLRAGSRTLICRPPMPAVLRRPGPSATLECSIAAP